MKIVITYGTYDLLHHGHIKLLERAKNLGDYLIVGVTGDDFDKSRGKINVQQSVSERIEAVRKTGLADRIIVEEYEGQKINDIKKYNVDIFAIGSDWKGKFNYLCEYCQVVYLNRTEGVSSSEIRMEDRKLNVGLVGESTILNKFYAESKYINGLSIKSIYSNNLSKLSNELKDNLNICLTYEELCNQVDALIMLSTPKYHYSQILYALNHSIHVLCESPLLIDKRQFDTIYNLADSKGLILMDSIKTAYSTAYYRLILLAKSGIIGKIISVDITCTSIRDINLDCNLNNEWNSISAWGPTAMLPVFQLLGTNYITKNYYTKYLDSNSKYDVFTRIDFIYSSAVSTVKVGNGMKSEGELIISGTNGYIYVPAPWWKTDYFEIRYENANENKRYFYQLDGEGIRQELVEFINAIYTGKHSINIDRSVSKEITNVLSDYYNEKSVTVLK